MSFSQYAASLLAGNALFRSVFASVFPLFGADFFHSRLGLGGGSSLLAGISILMIPALWVRFSSTLFFLLSARC
jgi:DHA1 family multidrug resistance protein-like MFS transporter